MNMKKISAVIALALSAGVASSANAEILVAGGLKFTLNNYDMGTTGYTGAGTICTTVASCDAAPGKVNAPGAIGSEDTWGVFSIASISKISDGSITYVSGQGGKYLSGIFYGLADQNVQVLAGHTFTYSTGGFLRMFENNSNWVTSAGAAGRIGASGYNSITNVGGTEVLDAAFSANVDASPEGLGSSYTSTFSNTGFVGAGNGYLNVTGGTWASILQTGQQFDPTGIAHDILLDTTFHPDAKAPNWTVISAGEATAAAIPEPASVMLFGLGLACLAILRRRSTK